MKQAQAPMLVEVHVEVGIVMGAVLMAVVDARGTRSELAVGCAQAAARAELEGAIASSQSRQQQART